MIALLLLLALAGPVVPTGLEAADTPNDEGGSIRLNWCWPEAESARAQAFVVQRSTAPDSGFEAVGEEPGTGRDFVDAGAPDGVEHWYRVGAATATDTAWSAIAGPTRASAQWFNAARANVLVILVVISAVFGYYIARARRGVKMHIRRIAGLDAIDEALGRATEMGKPILFSFGLGYITDMVVIAALPLLRRVAGRSAEYATRLLVPNSDPLVMTAAQETVREAYVQAGRPDLYSADNVNFLTSDQFGYAAGVDGLIMREKPGAIFWLGYFYAESLIMAETGHSVGAIQLAGTTETTQLPFFVAACDYTMIGEEIYAASCYLKPEPMMLGSIKGEDFLKLALIVVATLTVLVGTAAALLGDRAGFLATAFRTAAGWFALNY
ncbi:MAG: DUF6754 domain-containing protein [bacterium]